MNEDKDDQILNVSGYLFKPIRSEAIKPLREYLKKWGMRNNLKGTILLSTEGVNLFLSGQRHKLNDFLDKFRNESGFLELEVKESWSDHQPFTRFLVRIKKEIIAFGVNDIVPFDYTSEYLPPERLKEWLDQGKEVVLLDTRNDYEVKVGTFDNALPIGVENFTHFPEAAARLPEELKEKTIVTFCTGGIRCEKAAPLLESKGFKNVYQLEGGILKYFEKCGGAHYKGDCFVFDHRVALNPNLRETEVRQCYACRAVLMPDDFHSEQYIPGKQCPYCQDSDHQKQSKELENRNNHIKKYTEVLPGSIPYENVRPLKIPENADGMNILDFLDSLKFRPPEESWQEIIESGRMKINGKSLEPSTKLKAGTQIEHHLPGTKEPQVNGQIRVIYEDESIIVIDKPAPLPVHPSGRFNRNTLQYILRQVYSPVVPRCAHRLDANTSGIMVATKTKEYASILQPAFERGQVEKEYRARLHGHPDVEEFTCDKAISKESTMAGGRTIDDNGLAALTGFKVIKRHEDNTCSVLVRLLEGGRTHQIRIHSWALGYPVVGDPLYLPGMQMGETQTISPSDATMCLQSSGLVFIHPSKGHRVKFEAPIPNWWE